MVNQETVLQIKQAPVEERIQIIELILQSLKNDIKIKFNIEKSKYKPFKVRRFSLGEEVSVDRDKLYAERGV